MICLDPFEISFPDPAMYNPEEGIIAFGGDLSAERVLYAYKIGIFPWYNEGEEILWWCPDPRFVLYPKALKVSKSMQKILKNETFSFTKDKCFKNVMEQCKNVTRNGQDGTWISEELIHTFITLHKAGFAHSFEVWQGDDLVGGFYGIEINDVFCGESMFAKVSNASKAGFINFVQNYGKNLKIIDCQIHTAHLESLGAKMISKRDFLQILNQKNHES